MKNFSLKRTSSYDLKEGDIFTMTGGNVYRVFSVTDNYVHAMETSSERCIRLSANSKLSAPDYVSLALVDADDKRYNPNGLEANFMLSPI
jgi:hypothetical protein